MSQIDDETFETLKALCAIEVNPEEAAAYRADLQKILDYARLLEEVDTDDVQPTSHVFADMHNAFRADEEGELLPRETFLANSPEQVGGMIRVPEVIKE